MDTLIDSLTHNVWGVIILVIIAIVLFNVFKGGKKSGNNNGAQ